MAALTIHAQFGGTSTVRPARNDLYAAGLWRAGTGTWILVPGPPFVLMRSGSAMATATALYISRSSAVRSGLVSTVQAPDGSRFRISCAGVAHCTFRKLMNRLSL